jgi:hypothetical protein
MRISPTPSADARTLSPETTAPTPAGVPASIRLPGIWRYCCDSWLTIYIEIVDRCQGPPLANEADDCLGPAVITQMERL